MIRGTLGRGCPACDSGEFRPLVVVRGTQIFRCIRCGLATWDWRVFDFESFYDESYWKSREIGKGYADYFSLAGAMAHTHKERLAWIARHLPAPSRKPSLLDVGCGPGFFVQAATQAGFAAAGIEVSRYAVNFAREQLDQDVWQGQVRSTDLRSGPYNVVTMWDVIEHLADPADALAALAKVMAPRSVLALSTGDISSLTARLSGARWHLFNLPEHMWFFNPGSLRRLLRKAGLRPIDYRYETCWYPVRYLAERLEAMFASKWTMSAHLGPLGELCVPVTLADIVTVLARKVGAA